jgi:TolB-like protein/Tfp pilus assembly protein PilF
MSGDKEQEYFSDGLTEELLNSLARVNELRVAARTSSFSFKGTDTDIGTIAHKLNVGAVLEGSVRRSGNTVRITAQLINAVTGFHMWSETYDRSIGDVLTVQTDIANAAAGALKVTLLGDVAEKIELGGTRNPAAFDAYLRARKVTRSASGDKDIESAIAGYTEAIRLDPNYALAYAWRSLMYSGSPATGADLLHQQEADAREAIRLAPELAEGYAGLGRFFAARSLDFTQARENFERALALAPGTPRILLMSSEFLAFMGQFDEALSAARRAVTLDPLNGDTYAALGLALYGARRYREAIAALSETISLDPEWPENYATRAGAYYMLGDFEGARSSCETEPDSRMKHGCLAIVYDKLGRQLDAQNMLAKLKAQLRDAGAYAYAAIYAQWGNRAEALEWLEIAMRRHDSGLLNLKIDPLMDPLRKEPRFQAVMRELKFPQ